MLSLSFTSGRKFSTTTSGSGNAFTQISRIDFHATGSNVTYGLGGNIAFYTGKDGNGGSNAVYQVAGFENDQSARVFGNLIYAASTGATASSYVPGSSSGPGVPGQLAWDSGYLYVCVSANSWKRATLGTF